MKIVFRPTSVATPVDRDPSLAEQCPLGLALLRVQLICDRLTALASIVADALRQHMKEVATVWRVFAIAVFLSFLMSTVGAATPADMNRQLWFAPDEDSQDLLQLFTQPELWASVRPKINVFKIGPVMAGAKHSGPTGLEQLAAAGAFQRLREWGIGLALEAPAIKKWDCSGTKALEWTLQLIAKTKQAGGQIRYIAMDEPLAAAGRDCGLTFDQSADLVASYINGLRRSDPSLVVGDIIAYPHFNVAEIIRFERLLAAKGARPAFVHLDIDYNALRVYQNIDYASDLGSLVKFGQTEHFPLGIIFDPGRDPVSSDESYYRGTLSWMQRIHAAIGAPQQVIFQSWVTRSSRSCSDFDPHCTIHDPKCGPSDPPGCGQKSVPINLPEGDPRIYSHTRLINEGLRVLNW
jgi:hypothetical protein